MADVMKFSIVDSNAVAIPAYEENINTKGYVQWGPENAFPAFIKMLYEESATVRAVVDGSAMYICGNGIVIGDGAGKFKDECNRKGETLEDICEQLAKDLMEYNGFALQVIYDKLGAIAEIYALDFGRCRTNAAGTKVYYATKWGQWTSKYKEYDAFNRDRIDPANPTQIFFYKGSARTVYPKPTWEGAFRDALAEVNASKFVLNSMANGLAAKSIVTIPNKTGMLTDDDKREIEKTIQNRFAGPDATSSFFLYFLENGEEDLKIDTIKQEDESNRFINLKKSARENIFTAFRCSPNVFGLSNDNQGVFSKDNYNDAFSLYNRTQIKPRQKQIERVFDKILGSENSIKFLPFTIEDQE